MDLTLISIFTMVTILSMAIVVDYIIENKGEDK